MLDYEGLLYVEELATEDDNSLKNKLWNLFEAPESGNCARLVSLISVMVQTLWIYDQFGRSELLTRRRFGRCGRRPRDLRYDFNLYKVTAIITSTTIFCIETLPSFKEDRNRSRSKI